MTIPATEQVLAQLRTHPKVLFKPFVLQLLLIAAHIAVSRYFPQDTGFPWIDEWGQLVVHGVIALVEVTYVVIPALRWWNASFTVTDRRLIETWGVLYRSSREIPLDRIASVTTERGILDRIFRCGTLVFHDAAQAMQGFGRGLAQRSGNGVHGIRFHDIPNYAQVLDLIDQARGYG